MAVWDYKSLARHFGHKVQVVIYGDNINVAIECLDCNEVLTDFDNDKKEAFS